MASPTASVDECIHQVLDAVLRALGGAGAEGAAVLEGPPWAAGLLAGVRLAALCATDVRPGRPGLPSPTVRTRPHPRRLDPAATAEATRGALWIAWAADACSPARVGRTGDEPPKGTGHNVTDARQPGMRAVL